MTTIYSGGRHSGKTTLLIRQSARTGAVIVVPNYKMAEHVCCLAMEMELRIPKPITTREFLHNVLIDTAYHVEKHYLIDELQAMFKQMNVDGATIDDQTICPLEPHTEQEECRDV